MTVHRVPSGVAMAAFQVDDIAIAMLTVSREPQYIHRTVASLVAAEPTVGLRDPIMLMVDSHDADYLSAYSTDDRFSLVPLTAEQSAAISKWEKRRRFCHNYHRCLSLPLDGKQGLLVIEDDVIFRTGFLAQLVDALNEMHEHGLRRYALALFAAYDFERDRSFYRGRFYCSYAEPFYGTQAMFFPAESCRGLAAYVKQFGVDEYRAPGDLLIGAAYRRRLYATNRSLAQHVGEVSTGLADIPPKTVSFDRPWRPLSREEWGCRC